MPGCADVAGAARLAQQLALGALSVTAPDGADRLRASARALAEELGEPYVDAAWLRGPKLEALRLVIPAHDGHVTELDVAPDGGRAWSVGADDCGRLWDLANRASLLSVDDVAHVGVAWPGGVAFALDPAGGLSVIEPATGRRERLRTETVASEVRVSGDGRRLLLTGPDRVVLLDATSGRPLLTLPAPGGSGVAATPDLATVAVVAPGRLSAARVGGASWSREVDTGWRENWGYAESVAISADGRLLAWTAGPGGAFFVAACLVDDLDVRWSRSFPGPSRVGVDPSGRWVSVFTESDNRMYVLDAATGAELLDRPIPFGYLHTRIPLPSGDVFAAASTGEAYLLPTDAAREPVTLSGTSGVTALAASADGRVGVSGDTDGSLRAWDLERSVAPEQPGVTSVVATADGSALWTADTSGVVRLLDVADGDSIREHVLGAGPHSVHGCAPDGSTLVVTRPVPEDRLEVLVVDAGTGGVRELSTTEHLFDRTEGAWWVGSRWLIGVSGGGCQLREGDGTVWPPGSGTFADVRAVGDSGLLLGRSGSMLLVDAGGNVLREFPVAVPFINTYATQAVTVSGDGGTAVVANRGLHMLDLRAGDVRCCRLGRPRVGRSCWTTGAVG